MSFHLLLSTESTLVSSFRIAFSGQFFTQMPQTLQAAFSSGFPSFNSMAPKGQTCAQRPQPVHLRSKTAIFAMSAAPLTRIYAL